MTVVGKTIDDWNARILRHLHHHFVVKGAHHDALHHTFQILGHVVHRLSFTQVDLRGRKVERIAAQLLDAHIKSYPGA